MFQNNVNLHSMRSSLRSSGASTLWRLLRPPPAWQRPQKERAAPFSRSGPPSSKEMAQLGCRNRRGPDRGYSRRVCPQTTAPRTVLTPLSNITLDTGSPPFMVAVKLEADTDFVFVKRFYATRLVKLATMTRNGIKAITAIASLTIQSAVARDTHKGTTGP